MPKKNDEILFRISVAPFSPFTVRSAKALSILWNTATSQSLTFLRIAHNFSLLFLV
jgi:hypothetical protein